MNEPKKIIDRFNLNRLTKNGRVPSVKESTDSIWSLKICAALPG
jgi:hypothetical protein